MSHRPGKVSFVIDRFCNNIEDVAGLIIHMCTEQCHNPFLCAYDRVTNVLVEIGRSVYGLKEEEGGSINSNFSDGSCALSSACGFVVVAAAIVSNKITLLFCFYNIVYNYQTNCSTPEPGIHAGSPSSPRRVQYVCNKACQSKTIVEGLLSPFPLFLDSFS